MTPDAGPSAASRRGSVVALLLSNVVPAIGAIFLGWGVVATVLVYFIETAVIGVYTVLRVMFAGRGNFRKKLSLVSFFSFHFGTFVVGQTVVFVIFSRLLTKERFDSSVLAEVAVASLGFIVSHGVSFVVHYWRHERHQADADKEMRRPYGRVWVQQATVLFGALGMMMLELNHVAFVIILVVGKTALDLHAHLRSHAASSQTAGAA